MILAASILLAQASTDLPSTWGIVQTGGIAGILFLGLYLVFSGRIPTKQQLTQINEQLNEMTADRDFWRNLALRGTSLVEGHVKVTDEEISTRMEGLEAGVTSRLAAIEKMLKARGRDGP